VSVKADFEGEKAKIAQLDKKFAVKINNNKALNVALLELKEEVEKLTRECSKLPSHERKTKDLRYSWNRRNKNSIL